MAPTKLSLARLLLSIALGAVSTWSFGNSAPMDAPLLKPTNILQIMGCHADCLSRQFEHLKMPEVAAMYSTCLKQCGESDTLEALGCKITTCQHLINAYFPPDADAIARQSFGTCVQSSCALGP